MDRLGRGGRELRDVEAFDQLQRLQHRDAARARRAHAADLVDAIEAAQRRAFLRLVVREVGERQVDGAARCVLDRAHDRLGDAAAIEAVGALRGDLAQRRGIVRVLDDIAHLQRFAVRAEIGREVRERGQHRVALDRVDEARTGGESVFGDCDRGREQVGPLQAAVFLVREGEHGDRARHADGAAADDRFDVAERLAVSAQEQIRRHRFRRGLAAVVGFEALLLRGPKHQERAAADAGGLRLDQAHHHLGRDRRVDGAAALAQHLEAGIGREFVRGDDHVFSREVGGGRACQRRDRGECDQFAQSGSQG